jgi:predicted glutamine amidotransferase
MYDGLNNTPQSYHDSDPAAESALVKSLLRSDVPVETMNMVSHIRYATRGEVKLENVHPFQRELWGVQWCFAHNGDVSCFDKAHFSPDVDLCGCPEEVRKRKKKGSDAPCVQIPWIGRSIGVEDEGERLYNPMGATDSEAIFCAILNALGARFDTLPSKSVLHDAIASLCDEIIALDEDYEETTILNFLLGAGAHTQFAYSWPGAREGSTTWNGLHYTTNDRVALIATAPLSEDSKWLEIKRGELILFENGSPLFSCGDISGIECDGAVVPLFEIEQDKKKRMYKVHRRGSKKSLLRSMESIDDVMLLDQTLLTNHTRV